MAEPFDHGPAELDLLEGVAPRVLEHAPAAAPQPAELGVVHRAHHIDGAEAANVDAAATFVAGAGIAGVGAVVEHAHIGAAALIARAGIAGGAAGVEDRDVGAAALIAGARVAGLAVGVEDADVDAAALVAGAGVAGRAAVVEHTHIGA